MNDFILNQFLIDKQKRRHKNPFKENFKKVAKELVNLQKE